MAPKRQSGKNRSSPGSKSKYWNANHYLTWNAISYLSSNTAAKPFELSIDSYLKELEGIVDSKKSAKHKKRASYLLTNYRHGPDSREVRAWRKRELLRAQKLLVPPVVNNIITPPKAKREPKRKFVETQTPCPASFVKTYMSMDISSMWKLPSGAFVEQVLYDRFKKPGLELLVHSFVIDIHDSTVKELFEPGDWEAIIKKVPACPKNDPLLVKSMMRFLNLKTPAELREVLDTTSYMPTGETYDRNKHYDQSWVQLVMNMLLPLFEDPDQVLIKDHSEAWFDINIWSAIVDRCLQDLKGIVIIRGESTSMASTLRKNRNRVDRTKRQRIGSRFDGLGQDESGQFEYITMEAARDFEGETSNKWLHDYKKTAKSLHDMLHRLQSHANQDKPFLEKLQLAGLVSAGLHCQAIRMSYGDGHVCLLSHEDRHWVPTKVPDMYRLLQVLLSIWRIKIITRNCKAVVDGYLGASKKKDLFDSLMRSTSSPLKSNPKIPMSCDTDDEE